ncbi:MAG: DUF488 family protein [Candidatus Methanomethylophilaceae archaeon]|nr:DUF488 family protein [Candidatus Methanomethylophilaceae archaeon]
MAKVTQNGRALQMILPAYVCETANIRAGDELDMSSYGDTIVLRPRTSVTLQDDSQYRNTVYTIGYEGTTIEKFVYKLKVHGIEQLIDVREIPLSRKKGFSKNSLKEHLTQAGIKYIHMPELGSPSDIRHRYKEGGSEYQFFMDYEEYIDRDCTKDVQLMDVYASRNISVLMCFERIYVHCHRKILAEKLADFGYKVVHL